MQAISFFVKQTECHIQWQEKEPYSYIYQSATISSVCKIKDLNSYFFSGKLSFLGPSMADCPLLATCISTLPCESTTIRSMGTRLVFEAHAAV